MRRRRDYPDVGFIRVALESPVRGGFRGGTMNNEPIEPYGYWDEHPDNPVKDWQYEIANGDTRCGYWEWVKRRNSDE